MLHGYGKSKIAAIPAIKTVIENGNIISFTSNYNDYRMSKHQKLFRQADFIGLGKIKFSQI